jgi:ribosomal protein S18 acetylase RimI-like enzyme
MRSGIGRALMNKAAEWARAKACSEIQLQVHAFNAIGREFYRSLGFGDPDFIQENRLINLVWVRGAPS